MPDPHEQNLRTIVRIQNVLYEEPPCVGYGMEDFDAEDREAELRFREGVENG